MSSKKAEPFSIALGAIGIAAFGVFVFTLFSGDDEPDKKEEPKEYTSKHVDEDGPYSQEFLDYTKEVELDSFDGDWELGLVVQDFNDKRGVRVKTAKGLVVLYSSCEYTPASYISSMVNEGELIMWSKEADDHSICDGEVFVVQSKSETKELQESLE